MAYIFAVLTLGPWNDVCQVSWESNQVPGVLNQELEKYGFSEKFKMVGKQWTKSKSDVSIFVGLDSRIQRKIELILALKSPELWTKLQIIIAPPSVRQMCVGVRGFGAIPPCLKFPWIMVSDIQTLLGQKKYNWQNIRNTTGFHHHY